MYYYRLLLLREKKATNVMLKVDTMRIIDYFQHERVNGIFVIMDLNLNDNLMLAATFDDSRNMRERYKSCVHLTPNFSFPATI